mmetsp:Transcript_30974/g.71386  ORF Transcript_30974/g.71386 Transcript_30974/m.71386 type:complete len:108 (-) Transcript_30974:352-675(-)
METLEEEHWVVTQRCCSIQEKAKISSSVGKSSRFLFRLRPRCFAENRQPSRQTLFDMFPSKSEGRTDQRKGWRFWYRHGFYNASETWKVGFDLVRHNFRAHSSDHSI